jgi:hypothetical protein
MIGLAVVPLAIYSALYKFIPRYRLWSEASAYKEQARFYSDDRREFFAEYLADNYDLTITKQQALAALKAK